VILGCVCGAGFDWTQRKVADGVGTEQRSDGRDVVKALIAEIEAKISERPATHVNGAAPEAIPDHAPGNGAKI
jgi:hypothetical protein